MNKEDISKLDAKELIDMLVLEYESKDLRVFTEKVGINYTTITGWRSKNAVPESGNSRKYLEALLLIKVQERELTLFWNILSSFEALVSIKKNK